MDQYMNIVPRQPHPLYTFARAVTRHIQSRVWCEDLAQVEMETFLKGTIRSKPVGGETASGSGRKSTSMRAVPWVEK